MTAKLPEMNSFRDGFNAVVFGSSGGIGDAFARCLSHSNRCNYVKAVSRDNTFGFDITDENAIVLLADELEKSFGTVDLIMDATGVLQIDGAGPEKSISSLDPEIMTKAFMANTIGPALLIKHCARLLPVETKGVFATLSARVGSIEDNRLGGWYSYRASKAALNQIVKTASIEVSRKRPNSVLLALHPGTVESRLSDPFAKGRFTHSAVEASQRMLKVIDQTDPDETGGFFDYAGERITW